MEEIQSPLRNEKVTVRMIPRKSDLFEGDNHVLSGGMADNTIMSFTVPKDASGAFRQVLTDEERVWLEKDIGLEPGAMSSHKAVNNFWSSKNPLANIEVGKGGIILDLSKTEDYIKYKVLLTNTELICKSIEQLERRPKATYRFVLVHKAEELKSMDNRVTVKMECYKAFGKIEDDKYKLKTIIEIMNNTVYSDSTSIEWLKEQCVGHIDRDAKRFLQTVRDPLLDDKIFVKKCIDAGLVSNRSGRMFIRKGDTPMCENGEEATLAMAARWISNPRHQDIRLILEAQMNGEDPKTPAKKK